ncbi:DNA-binding Lrp family transcriptional regulator [Kineococcus xinjiangensis]|uniref:DNA-binding Lrp family transcriptional regulator n=1 Tax=Kineococcus xinjiangensis TaxID=512762 RepID=A0A2S6IUB2_9ACTN|nr:Lrp/AsnC family transcriptional regulator [Kineococcus xinjiangensis]PPK97725.1 DNA-binding Lrp family transcriptional regulator [Kineococcus xinjiangensis]
MSSIDRLDADLLAALSEDPRRGISELAALTGVARNTVMARLSRLSETGVLQGYDVRVDLERLGLPVTAFLHLQLAQGGLQEIIDALARFPEVLEICITTGASDLVVRVACPGNAELQAFVQEVLAVPGVVRTTTEIALTTPVPYRVAPLLAALTAGRGRGRAGRPAQPQQRG